MLYLLEKSRVLVRCFESFFFGKATVMLGPGVKLGANFDVGVGVTISVGGGTGDRGVVMVFAVGNKAVQP